MCACYIDILLLSIGFQVDGETTTTKQQQKTSTKTIQYNIYMLPRTLHNKRAMETMGIFF